MLVFAAELLNGGWTTAMAVVAAAALLLIFYYNRNRSSTKDGGGKMRYPPMSSKGMFETIKNMSGDDAPWFFIREGKELGTNVYRLNIPVVGGFGGGTPPMAVVVGDYKLAREILTDKATIKPLQLYQGFTEANGGIQSLFSSNGTFWHVRRKGVAPAFSSNHVQRMNSIALAKTDEWIRDRLRPLIAQNKSFDVGDEMIDLLLCAITQTAFEYKISPSEVALFKHENELVLREFLMKTQLNPLRKVFGLCLRERRRAKLAAQRIQALALKIIAAYRARTNPLRGTIIDLICSNPCYKNDIERSADIIVMLLAGHDTTAYTLAWTLKELAKNPTLQRELRASIHNSKKDGDNDDPSKLEAVHHVIREGIRLHPVSGLGSVRTVGRDFVTQAGELIPKGSIAFTPIIMMTRDPTIFGCGNGHDDDNAADKFIPSRWETATPQMNQAFMPFAAGRQNCVGQPLANAELHCILPRIISEFELTIEEEGTTETFLTIKPIKCMIKAQSVAQA